MNVITPYGTVTVSVDDRALSAHVTSTGALSLPAGNWRVVQVASDTVGGQSATREQLSSGGVVDVDDIDHLAFRQDNAGDLLYSLSVQLDDEHDAGEWVEFDFAARPGRGDPLLGAQVFYAQPGSDPIQLLPTLDHVDGLPAGITVVRLALAWASLQPNAASTWDPAVVAHIDDIVAGLGQREVALMLSVGTTPTWAGGGSSRLEPPGDPADFGQWVDDILDRWGQVVDIVSIDPWNEANLTDYFKGTPADMAAMTAAAHTAAAGRTVVTTPSLAGGDIAYLESLFAAGLTNGQFDGVDVHPYPLGFEELPGNDYRFYWLDPAFPPSTGGDLLWRSSPVGAIHGIEALLDQWQMTDKGIYISEFGVPDNPTGADAPGRPENPQLRMTGQRAAQWCATFLDQMMRSPSVAAITFHEATDITGAVAGTSWNAAWGLSDIMGHRRTKWYALDAAT